MPNIHHMSNSNLPQTETNATGHHFKYVQPKSNDTGHFVRCVTDRYCILRLECLLCFNFKMVICHRINIAFIKAYFPEQSRHFSQLPPHIVRRLWDQIKALVTVRRCALPKRRNLLDFDKYSLARHDWMAEICPVLGHVLNNKINYAKLTLFILDSSISSKLFSLEVQ